MARTPPVTVVGSTATTALLVRDAVKAGEVLAGIDQQGYLQAIIARGYLATLA